MLHSTNRPRVLHVLEAFRGGTARHLLDVLRNTAAVEHHVVVPGLTIGAQGEATAGEELEAIGVEVHYVPMRRNPMHPSTGFALPQLRSLIRDLTPDVVHGHSSIGGAVARTAAAGTGSLRFYTPNGLQTNVVARVVERALGHITDCLIAVSPSEAALALRLHLVPAPRIRVIPNGIDLSQPPEPEIDLRRQLALPPDAQLVGWIGRLTLQKDPEAFVHVAQLLGGLGLNRHFVMIGSGPLDNAVQSAVRDSGLARVVDLIPWVPNARGLMGQLDVLASTSRFEGAPYAPLEAMAAGVPVVLTDVVGNRDAVEDRISGVLVPPGDPRAMAIAIERLLRDVTMRRGIGAEGQARVRQLFDARTMGRLLGATYLEEIAHRGR